MEYYLDLLTKYSNLILVVITGIYAYLTWRMVREMKIARENQLEANLIASPVPMGSIYAQVQLENAGPGPAFNVELSISLDPPLQTNTNIWKHPSFLVGKKELFLLPYEINGNGSLPSLQETGAKHEKLIIIVKWKNIFGHKKITSNTYKLNELADGWYKAGLLMPEDLPAQMKETTKVLDKIHQDIEKIARELSKPNPELTKTKSKKTAVASKKRLK
jgi:hypothetical protein